MQKTQDTTKARNYGLDILKIISMYAIVVLHVLGKGGVLANATGKTLMATWLMETICYGAVDTYAMISGFISKPSSIERRVSRLLELWVLVVFYSLVISVISFIVDKDVNWHRLLEAMTPVIHNAYWYFSSYVLASLFFPAIDSYVESANLDVQKRHALALFIMSSFGTTIVRLFKNADPFSLSSGYSAMWLLILYYLGKILYLSNVEKKVSPSRLLTIILAMTLISWLWKITWSQSLQRYFALPIDRLFLLYTSPTIVINAAAVILLFSKLYVSNNTLVRELIKRITASAFSVYIIHTNGYIFNNILKDSFIWIANNNSINAIIMTTLISVSIFVTCILIDILRAYLFRIGSVNSLVIFLCKKICIQSSKYQD